MKEKIKIDLQTIINILMILIIVGGLITIIYLFSSKKDENKYLVSRNNYFVLTIPDKYNFSNNSTALNDEENYYEMAVTDKNNNIYIFANLYDLVIDDIEEVTFEEYVLNDLEYFSTSDEYEILEEIKKISIRDYEALYYTMKYVDLDTNKEYYHVNIWINGSRALYLIELECLFDEAENLAQDLLNIVQTFMENN